MDLLNFFDYQDKPLLRSILVVLTVVNAIVLAFLIFFARQPEAVGAEAVAAAWHGRMWHHKLCVRSIRQG